MKTMRPQLSALIAPNSIQSRVSKNVCGMVAVLLASFGRHAPMAADRLVPARQRWEEERILGEPGAIPEIEQEHVQSSLLTVR